MNRPISIHVIRRLPRYLRLFEELIIKNVERISSYEIAELMDVTPSQVRQDFALYGTLGMQGYGYHVRTMRDELLRILGVDRGYRVILLGAGHFGTAIIENFDYIFKGYTFLAAFDIDPGKIGKTVGGRQIQDVAELAEFVEKNVPDIAIITVPREEAQRAADELAAAGIRSIWNFTGVEIESETIVENILLADSLLVLTYKLNAKDLEQGQ